MDERALVLRRAISQRHIGDMHDNRIIPGHRVYKVVKVELNGIVKLIRAWPTEEAALSHLKTLRGDAASVPLLGPEARGRA